LNHDSLLKQSLYTLCPCVRFKDQEIALTHIRLELEQAEARLRHANENELPEERIRLVVEQKRKELSHLMQSVRDEDECYRREAHSDYYKNRQINSTNRSSYLYRDDSRSNTTMTRTYRDH